MENLEAISKWYVDWRNELATTTALNKFKKISGTNDRSNTITKERIAIACFNAAHYKPELDPGEIYRAKMAKQRKQMTQLQKAAKVLAEAALQNHRGLDWASTIAAYNSGLHIAPFSRDATKANLHVNREPRNGHLGKYDYFSHLEKALHRKDLPEINGKKVTQNYTKGNLFFNKHISRGKKITIETMLAFELAFYLRMHTAGRADDSINNGQGMPDDGDPCFEVVAAFCNAIFNNGWDAKRIGDNVRELKNAGLTVWQGVN